jgi:hypothetical protein
MVGVSMVGAAMVVRVRDVVWEWRGRWEREEKFSRYARPQDPGCPCEMCQGRLWGDGPAGFEWQVAGCLPRYGEPHVARSLIPL